MIPFEKPGKFGLISGFALIIYNVLMYAFDINIFNVVFLFINGLIVFGVMITMTVIGVNKMRDDDLEKKITFMQAALGAFIILLISSYLINIFDYLLHGFIDTEYLPSKMEGLVASLEGKVPADKLDEIVKQTEEGVEPTKAFIKSLWMSPLISAVVGAIIALFIKKDKTEQIPV